MKGASKVIMGATLVMVVTLAIVLGLVLVLLAELYCTLLLRRRRQLRHSSHGGQTTTAAPTTATESANSNTTVLTHPSQVPRSFTPGLLEAPRNLFYPSIKEKKTQESRKLHTILQMHIQESKSSPLPASSSPPNEVQIQVKDDKDDHNETIVYISNPIYQNIEAVETPFETPDSSPSRLETGSPGSGSTSSDEVGQSQPCVSTTPPLTPMKKLPKEASSVSLRDARSLGPSGSDSVSNNGLSSSSSGSPSTSPSW